MTQPSSSARSTSTYLDERLGAALVLERLVALLDDAVPRERDERAHAHRVVAKRAELDGRVARARVARARRELTRHVLDVSANEGEVRAIAKRRRHMISPPSG